MYEPIKWNWVKNKNTNQNSYISQNCLIDMLRYNYLQGSGIIKLIKGIKYFVRIARKIGQTVIMISWFYFSI